MSYFKRMHLLEINFITFVLASFFQTKTVFRMSSALYVFTNMTHSVYIARIHTCRHSILKRYIAYVLFIVAIS